MDKKDLKILLICVSVYVAIAVINFSCIYALQGENFWNYLKECWDWYKKLFI